MCETVGQKAAEDEEQHREAAPEELSLPPPLRGARLAAQTARRERSDARPVHAS